MKYEIFDSFVNISNKEEYFRAIDSSLKSNSRKRFFYQNSYSLYLASKNLEFRKSLNNSEYIVCDGFSASWLAEKRYKKKISKVVFTYFFYEKLASYFSENNIKIYLLGSTKKIIKSSSEILVKKYHLIIAGYNDGYFEKNDSEDIIKNINESRPEVLIVGMGMPVSEIWINENFNKLNVNCIFSVGGFFDFISGKNKTAPDWLYNSGLEWIYRLIQEPKRLFGRYLKSHGYFLIRMLRKK